MKIGIMGLGLTGAAAAEFALDLGDEVFISEAASSSPYTARLKKRGAGRFEFGGHTERLLETDLILKSPGISPSDKILLAASRRGVPVTGELDFVLARTPRPGKILAVTGTNGKTTVASLLGEILKSRIPEVLVCGNIGLPLSSVARRITPRSSLVMEVSSYQLEDSAFFRPDIAVLLNVTPDHLEHHGSFRNYIAAKARIFGNQTKDDRCIFNRDDDVCVSLARKSPAKNVFFSVRREYKNDGVYCRKDGFVFNFDGRRRKEPIKLRIRGAHNLSNASAAFAAAYLAGVSVPAIKRASQKFAGVPHRIEKLAVRNGVFYVNDSKSTNVSSTLVALDALGKNIWLILGGRDKGSSYRPLIPLLREKVKGIFAVGEAARKISRELSSAVRVEMSGDLTTAVRSASAAAVPGDTVLLSPACSSFDQFRDFEHRGETFRRITEALPRRT